MPVDLILILSSGHEKLLLLHEKQFYDQIRFYDACTSDFLTLLKASASIDLLQKFILTVDIF